MSIKPITQRLNFNPSDLVGMILDRAMQDVENTLNRATDKVHDAAVDVLMKAAEQAIRTITNLKGAYTDCLDKTYHDVDKAIRENIDRANDLAATVVSESKDAMLQVADKIQDIIKLSPLSNWWLPLLSEVSPRFFALEADPTDPSRAWITQVKITFKGNFAYADRPDCKPIFTFEGKEYSVDGSTTKELIFFVDIPSDHPQLRLHRYSYLHGSLQVRWKSGWMSWTNSTYQVLLGVLPASVGKIEVVYKKAMSAPTQIVHSAPISIEPDKSHWKTDTASVFPDQGWKVVPDTAAVHWIEGPHGQVNAHISAQNEDRIDCEYARKKGSGKISIDFMETKTNEAELRSEIHDSLKWGCSFIAEPAENETVHRVNFDPFNGEHAEFQPRTNDTNSFITLREYDGTLEIKARKSKEIVI